MVKKTEIVEKRKNQAAVALGRLGGKAKKSRPFGFQTMTKTRVKQVSAQGVAARKKRRQALMETCDV